MTDVKNEPAYSKNVIEFITVAHNFCLTLESSEKYEKEEFLEIILKMLPLLYLKATLLPRIPEPDPDQNERFLTLEQYEKLFNKLRSIFEKEDVSYTLNLKNQDHEPLKVSVSEMLSDIYQDMKDFVWLYQKQSRASKQNAVYHVRLNFLQHWSIKALNSIKILHYIVFGDFLEEEL